jgi:hypothetical protein
LKLCSEAAGGRRRISRGKLREPYRRDEGQKI